jgi:signal transduction histidine kinase
VTTTAPPLYRADSGRLIAGVARGLADHLRVEVRWVRLAFVALAFVAGSGVLIYGALWVVVPVDPKASPTQRSKVASTLLVSLAAVAIGVVLLLQFLSVLPGSAAPLTLVLLGAALVWLRNDDRQRQQFLSRVTGGDTPARVGWSQVLVGGGLIVAGFVGLLASQGSLADAGPIVFAAIVVTAGFAVLIAPWAIGLLRDRDAERLARIRSEERADIAAHVHDSVLQTLTLIQRNAADPGSVARLARAQERDLRHWLYEPVPDAAHTLRGALESAAADVEDAHGVPIELVAVSDVAIDERLLALSKAAKEAMVNAAKYGGSGGAVSVFSEVAEGSVTVFVRDRGPGFDIDAIPDDRKGIRESIMGRMSRVGGTAHIRRMDDAGTQVELTLKVAE